MCSDSDGDLWETLDVGFDVLQRLVVAMWYYNDCHKEDNCAVSAVLDRDETIQLARRLKVPVEDLPQKISESEVFEEYRHIVNADLADVEECFKLATDFLVDEGCHFKIIREPGKHGYCRF